MKNKFEEVVSACRAVPKDKGFEFLFNYEDGRFAVRSTVFDLSSRFRKANGNYDYRIFHAKVASAFEAVSGIIDAPLAADTEPTFCFCVDGSSPKLGDNLLSLARTDPAFFIVVAGQEQNIPKDIPENIPVILVDIA